jgi:hypothetical protein
LTNKMLARDTPRLWEARPAARAWQLKNRSMT